ncbi:hypothetical protein FS842_005266 [Serendipita sp. 407]|nr:hypothetical protein FS842_005266 [Serendipita sp. 407]
MPMAEVVELTRDSWFLSRDGETKGLLEAEGDDEADMRPIPAHLGEEVLSM